MKRILAATVLFCALVALAVPAFALPGQASHWKTERMTFRSTATLGKLVGDPRAVPVLDSTYACLNGTAADTTKDWMPSDFAPTSGNAAVVLDSMTHFRFTVVANPGSSVDLNLPTITVQGTVDGYTWFDLLAATSTVALTATAEKATTYLWTPGLRVIGFNRFRFILTGISGTTGCMNLYVSYPATN